MRMSDRIQQKRIYARQMQEFERSAGQDQELRWRWLTAVHSWVGPISGCICTTIRPCWVTPCGREIGGKPWGQLFRIAFVPLGHTFGRLPTGNIGRSTVSAFQPMSLDAGTPAAISRARRQAMDEAARSLLP